MSNEVLLAILLCIAGFISWRLRASYNEENEDVGFPLFVLVIVCYVSYVMKYGNGITVGLALFTACFIGFFSKVSLKLPWRKKVRRAVKKTVGDWKLPPTEDQDEHRQNSI